MQDPQSRYTSDPILTARILVLTLKLTRKSQAINIHEIAEAARTTTEEVETALNRILGPQDFSNLNAEPLARFRIAIEASRLGALQDAAKGLTWQEFEAFGDECLILSGFETRQGLVLKDEFRKWQIDIVARKAEMVLAIDCKHWNSPNYLSKFDKAAQHQKSALSVLMREKSSFSRSPEWGLPVILTLHDPRTSIYDDVVLVSVGQFSDFLNHLTPYDTDLPFVSSKLAESPIC